MNNPAQLSARSMPCVHRDDKPFTSSACASCNQTLQVDVYKCRVHGRCSLTVLVPGIQCCHICTDRSGPGGAAAAVVRMPPNTPPPKSAAAAAA